MEDFSLVWLNQFSDNAASRPMTAKASLASEICAAHFIAGVEHIETKRKRSSAVARLSEDPSDSAHKISNGEVRTARQHADRPEGAHGAGVRITGGDGT